MESRKVFFRGSYGNRHGAKPHLRSCLQVSLGAPWQLPVVPPGRGGRRQGARWKIGGDEPIPLNDNWGYP